MLRKYVCPQVIKIQKVVSFLKIGAYLFSLPCVQCTCSEFCNLHAVQLAKPIANALFETLIRDFELNRKPNFTCTQKGD